MVVELLVDDDREFQTVGAAILKIINKQKQKDETKSHLSRPAGEQ